MDLRKNKGWNKDADIIIPVMGSTGSGKSTFINNLIGKPQMETTDDMESCTKVVESVVLESQHLEIKYPILRGRRLVIVDTPGFNGTEETESETLRRIAVWLASCYRENMTLGGVIHLHSIGLSQVDCATKANFNTFRELCGNSALKSVVLVTTMWNTSQDAREQLDHRHDCLLTAYWRDMVKQGATVHKLEENNATAAWAILDLVLGNIEILPTPVMAIQKELVDLGRGFPDTAAGKSLRGRYQTSRSGFTQSDDPEIMERFRGLDEQIRESQQVPVPSLSRRFLPASMNFRTSRSGLRPAMTEEAYLTRSPTFSSDENVALYMLNSKAHNRPSFASFLPSAFQRVPARPHPNDPTPASTSRF